MLCDRAFGATHSARFLKLAEMVGKIEPIHRPPTAEDFLAEPPERATVIEVNSSPLLVRIHDLGWQEQAIQAQMRVLRALEP